MSYTTDARICRPWIQKRLHTEFGPYATFIARLREDGSVWGCVVYDRVSKFNCEMHMAGDPGWVSKAMLKAAFAYPFRQLGLDRVTGLVASDDEYVLALDKRMGFVEEGRMREALGPGIDIVILGMKRDECRYNWSK